VLVCWHKLPILGCLLSACVYARGREGAEVCATDRRYVSGILRLITAKVSIKQAQSSTHAPRPATQTPCQTPYSPQEAPVDSYRLSSNLHWVGLIVRCSTYILLSLSVASALTTFSLIFTQLYQQYLCHRRYNHNQQQSSE
jgi:hypothetical protein